MNGAMLRCYRDYLGLSQNELAEVFDVHRVTLANWENENPKYPLPPGLATDMEMLLLDADTLVDDMVTGFESETIAPVVTVYRTVEDLLKAKPGFRPASCTYWNMIAARVVEQCEFEVDIIYST